ncbi:hypothetical protein GLX27_001597 [Malassezia furfur]|uniref:Origin recognition complex subunit 5 C-terminal domain-containing protein n=1 Tax=Malassezia furfur TaxID=55194 RepID=A0ABY8ERG1_MALFU|nr:hypothetical protein GLX27_001597 [Malassezia furfur]
MAQAPAPLGVPDTLPDLAAWAPPMHTLTALLGPVRGAHTHTAPLPPAVLVHAPHSPTTAARLVRSHVHAHRGVRVAHVSPLTACTPRLAFAHAVRQLGGGEPGTDLHTFLQALRRLARTERLVLVVHDAERVRDLWPESLWTALPLLAEMAALQGRLCIVFVSALPWSAFRDVGGRAVSAAPIAVRIPRLARADMLALLAHDAAPTTAAYATREPDATLPDTRALHALHAHVAALVYDSVKARVRDEHEVRVVLAAVWHALLPSAAAQGPNAARLMPVLAELIRDALQRLVPRTLGAAQWVREHAAGRAAEPASAPVTWPGRTGVAAVPAFLLIAAFLASYNPPKTDVRYFVRELGNSRKRRRRGKGQSAADAALLDLEGEREIWDRTQFWGPRAFPLERLLAIYHALLADFALDLNEDALLAANERAARAHDRYTQHLEHVAGEFGSRSATALAQINALVVERRLVRMAPAGKLGAMQYRVNVPYAEVRALAHAVGFPLDVWLWDRYYGS